MLQNALKELFCSKARTSDGSDFCMPIIGVLQQLSPSMGKGGASSHTNDSASKGLVETLALVKVV